MFLRSTLATALLAALPARSREGRPARILLRNAWQSINIGDIAHYLGMLELLSEYLPDAEVRLWPSNLENGARELLRKTFPDCLVVEGKEQVATAFRECDFFLHGSSSGFGALKDVQRWIEESGKPFGVFGISLTSSGATLIETLDRAAFAFFRESVSLRLAREKGCKAPIMAFAPDTAFGVVKLRNHEAATAFLGANGLEEGKFLCCIPRYRWTPFWTVKKGHEFDPVKHARNEEMKEHDHAPHRAAIEAITRETDMKVLITCEDQTQIPLGKEMLYDPLPADVKKKVVWRDRYWLTDEALSTYVRSVGLFGNEMHSPIMCISSGIPAVVCRFDEQTQKGFMWHDIGLQDWLFTLDKPDEVERIVPTVLSIAQNQGAARAKAAAARDVVRLRQKESFGVLTSAVAETKKR